MKHAFPALLFALLPALLHLPPAHADAQRAAAETIPREPSLAEIHRAALRHAGLDDEPERGWARRTRLAGLMPILSLRASSGTAHDEGLSRASSGTERLDIGVDRDLSFEAKAVWRLDRLLFDDVEIRAVQMARQRHRARMELLAQITTLYYQRRKLQLAKGAKDDAARALAIEELAAQLDALTGGYFRRAGSTPK